MDKTLIEFNKAQVEYYKNHLKELREWKKAMDDDHLYDLPIAVRGALHHGENHYVEMIEIYERRVKEDLKHDL